MQTGDAGDSVLASHARRCRSRTRRRCAQPLARSERVGPNLRLNLPQLPCPETLTVSPHWSFVLRHSSFAVARISDVWLVVPCLACDFLMAPVFSIFQIRAESLAALAFGIVGCVFAQGNLLAAWLAWSEGSFLRRLATHWIIAAGLYLVWLAGLAVRGHPQAREFAVTVALGVPLVSIAAQFPLWVARQWFGWRLVNENAVVARPLEPALKIRDLMLATVLVAASL